MDPASILTTVIEVAIGIAGFSGIVAALSQRGAAISTQGFLYLRVLLTASLLCIFFSFLPLLIANIGADERATWTIPSGLWAAAFLLVLIYRAFEFRKNDVNSGKQPIVFLAAFAALAAVFLCLINVVIVKEAWPYLVSMVLILFAAAFSFIALLYEVLGPPAGT